MGGGKVKGTGHIVVSTVLVGAADAALRFVPGDLTAAGLALGAAGLGALLPDVDSDESAIRQQWGLARSGSLGGKLLSAGLGAAGVEHRGVTHSLVAVGVALALGLSLYLAAPRYAAVGLAFALGYLGHLAGDMLTRSGVPLLWPKERRFHLLPEKLRFHTGGGAEYAVTLLAALLLGLLLLSGRGFLSYLLGGLL
jgi:inner membrane protein